MKKYIREYGVLVRNSSFMKVIIAGFISSLGSKISYFALLRKVYEISNGKITDLGFLSMFEIAPFIIFGGIAGTIIDKVSRKKVMVISDILSGFVTLCVMWINNIYLIYLMAFMASTVYAFREPAQSAFEPNLVDKENIALLNSFKASMGSITQIIGAAFGAAVVGFVGFKNAFVIDAVSFWCSALIIFTIIIKETHFIKVAGKSENGHFKEFIDGISIMYKNSSIKLMILIDLFITFAMSMQGMLIYIFIRQTLKMGNRAEMAWGILLSSLGVGAMIGSLVIGVVVKRYKNKFKLFLNVLLFDSACFTAFLLNTYFPLSVVLFAFLGCIGTVHSIVLNTVLQDTVPDENRGKVFSTFGMLRGPISILSIAVGTAAASVLSAQIVLLMAAFIELLIGVGVRFTKTYKEVEG